MQTLFDQLNAIATHAAAISAEAKRKQADADAATRLRSATRQRSWESRKDGGKFAQTGLSDALLARLPKTEKTAMTLSAVEALVSDVPHAASGLSATLVNLKKQGFVERTGEVRNYRYYLKNPKGKS